MPQLRIITWNIGGGFIATDDPLRFDTEELSYFATTLRSLDGDVICLQECHTPVVSTQISQAQQLAQVLHIPHWCTVPYGPYCQSPFDPTQNLALAILSRWAFLSTHYEMLPNPGLHVQRPSGEVWGTHDKGFLRARLAVGDGAIVVLTGHTTPFELYGRDAAELAFAPIHSAMETIILSSARFPTIVTGDLNYDAVERLLPKVFQAGYVRVLENVATEPRYGRQRDHILLSPHCTALDSAVLPGQADHFLCYADVVVRE
jgi:endonuclease/exonuclease/phosphatase family metal-dependent hydrolase